jgi:hypothetical protein
LFSFVIHGDWIQAVLTAFLTTTVLVLLGGIPLWYETTFNNKMAIVATAGTF